MTNWVVRRAWWLLVAFLVATLLSSCTVPVPPPRQAGASGRRMSTSVGMATSATLSMPTQLVPTRVFTGTSAPASTVTSVAAPITPRVTLNVTTMVMPIATSAAAPITARAPISAPHATATPSLTTAAAPALSPFPITSVTANPRVFALATTAVVTSLEETALYRAFLPTMTETPEPTVTTRLFSPTVVFPTVTPVIIVETVPVTPTVRTLIEVPSSAGTPEVGWGLTPAVSLQVSPTAKATMASLTPTRAPTARYKTADVVKNGDFEQGFDPTGIGVGWKGFSRVDGSFGWSDETDPSRVADGAHAQLMRIRKTRWPDAFIGIYQTVQVVPGRPYELSLRGLIRSAEGNPHESGWGYRVQIGFDPKGGENANAVREWIDVGWDEQPMNTAENTLQEFKMTIVPRGRKLTLFIRCWRKWATPYGDGEFVVDAVHLFGPVPLSSAG